MILSVLKMDEEEDASLAALRAAIEEGDASPDVVGFDRERFLQELKAERRDNG